MDHAPMVTLEGVDGSQFALSAIGSTTNIWLNRGAKGLDMPVFDVQVDEFPAIAGSVPRSARGASREIFLPLTIWGASRAEVVATKRRLLRALPPTRMFRRMAKLVVAEISPEGAFEEHREIDVYYSSGLEGDEGSESGLTWMRFGLVLQTTDPYFRAQKDIRAPFFSYGQPKGFFPPKGESFVSRDGVSGGFKLSSNPVFTTKISVTNPGDESVFPTFEFVGPLSGPFNLVRRPTAYSGEGILSVKALTLAAGQSATLVTEPGRVSLSTSTGGSAVWSSLVTNPTFWTLDPGTNTVEILGLPAGVQPSSAAILFRPRYLGM